MKLSHPVVRFAAVTVLIIVSLFVYGVWVEPQWIEVTHQQVEVPGIRPFTLVQLSDLHTRGLGGKEERMLRIVESLAPDIIVITGDSITDGSTYADVKDVHRLLRAEEGIYFVRGNWENALSWEQVGLGEPPKPNETEMDYYRSSGITYLNNSNVELQENFYLVGVDEFTRGNPDFARAVEGIPEGAYRLVLFHSPEYFDQVSGQVNLVLAGHTHGGQIRVPGFPPLYAPPGSGNYLAGWYEKGQSRMYVNRGLGTSVLGVRIHCRPEITHFSFVSAGR